MPQFEKQIIAKCDNDETPLKVDGGYHNEDKGNDILIYVCPKCGFIYLNFDGKWIDGRWMILNEDEAQNTETKFVR